MWKLSKAFSIYFPGSLFAIQITEAFRDSSYENSYVCLMSQEFHHF